MVDSYLPLTLERESRLALKDSNPFSVASRTCDGSLAVENIIV